MLQLQEERNKGELLQVTDRDGIRLVGDRPTLTDRGVRPLVATPRAQRAFILISMMTLTHGPIRTNTRTHT